MAQLDLFGVSRRFPSIRHLNRKEKKKEKQQDKLDKKPAKDGNKGGDGAATVLPSGRVGNLTVAGQLYSLPVKKSPALLAAREFSGSVLLSGGVTAASEAANNNKLVASSGTVVGID